MILRLPFARVFMSLVVFSTLLASVAYAQSESEIPPDFRDLYWGDPLTALGRGAIEVSQSDGIVAYTKLGDNPSLGSLRANYIAYMFFDNKLLGVVIGIRDADTGKAKEILNAKYGKPVRENQFSDDASWATDRTLAFLYDRYSNSQILLLSIEINTEYEMWRAEQAAKDAQAW